MGFNLQNTVTILTLTRSLRRKFGWGGFSTFRRWRSRVFLNRTSLIPPQIFDAHLLESTNLSPSGIHFSVDFISRSIFESNGFKTYSKEWYWREKNDVYSHLPTFNHIILQKKGTYFLSNYRWVTAEPQFSARRTHEG